MIGRGYPPTRMKTRLLLATALALVAVVVGLVWASSPAWAATITVDSLADDADGTDGECTLREAITAANTDAASGTAPGECAAGSGEDGIDIGLTGTVDLAGALPALSSDMAIAGPGADEFTVRRNTGGDYGIFTVASGSVVSISGITVSNGNANNGGGISNNEGGTLTVAGSTISDNAAQTGGGINNRGILTVTGSTISDNSSSSTGIGGGGVYTDTLAITGAGTTTITNSTISGNTTEGFGGGVYNEDGRTVIEHSTITGNTAPSGQGSGVASYGDPFTPTEVLSSIVSANTNTDVDFVNGATNSFVSEGYNLIGDGNATGDFDQPGDDADVGDPGLDPLGSYGGPTPTHRLQPDSPAVDAGPPADGDPTACPPPETDQRGVQRPQDGDGDGTARCDVGAFELQPNRAPSLAVARGGDCKPTEGGAPAGTINLVVADAESDPADLILSAASSDQAVVPEGGISFGGTGADRTLTVSPNFSDAVGAAMLAVEVSDGEDTASVPTGVTVGTLARDALVGTANPDMIFARNGADSVSGRAANDLICGAPGDDVVRGQSGNDTLRADGGEDTLSGGVGADFFGGGPGTDTATDFDAGQGDKQTGIP